MKTKSLNVKTITCSVIAIATMLVLSNCTKIKQEPTVEQVAQVQEPVLANPDMQCKYEEQVKVYDVNSKDYLVYLVKSNSRQVVDNTVKSLKVSKIEIFDPPKMVSSNMVQTSHSPEVGNSNANSKDFVVIKVIEQSFQKGKAVKLSMRLLNDAASTLDAETNRADQLVGGTADVYFYYYSSTHQILNYFNTILYRDYKIIGGTLTQIEAFYLGAYTNHIDSQGQYLDRMLHAHWVGNGTNSILFDITYW